MGDARVSPILSSLLCLWRCSEHSSTHYFNSCLHVGFWDRADISRNKATKVGVQVLLFLFLFFNSISSPESSPWSQDKTRPKSSGVEAKYEYLNMYDA